MATENVTPGASRQVTLALGFGRSQAQSVSVAKSSLSHPFALTAASYLAGWAGYDARLRPPPAREARLATRYYLSANVLKASEDKTFPGAIVASLASPWGQSVPAGVTANGEPSYFGSYREVFARDLYEAFTGLMADGDVATARAATLFLFDRQQLPDGAMPRNSLLNGKAAAGHRRHPAGRGGLPDPDGVPGRARRRRHLVAGPHPAGRGLPRRQRPVRRRGALGGADRLLPVHDRGRDRRPDRRVRHRREPRRRHPRAPVPGHRRRLPAQHQDLDGDHHRPGRARATSSGCPRPATRTRPSATASATAAPPWTSAP